MKKRTDRLALVLKHLPAIITALGALTTAIATIIEALRG